MSIVKGAWSQEDTLLAMGGDFPAGRFAREVRQIEPHYHGLDRSAGGILWVAEVMLPNALRPLTMQLRASWTDAAWKIAKEALFRNTDPESRRPLDQVLGCGPRDIQDARIISVRQA